MSRGDLIRALFRTMEQIFFVIALVACLWFIVLALVDGPAKSLSSHNESSIRQAAGAAVLLVVLGLVYPKIQRAIRWLREQILWWFGDQPAEEQLIKPQRPLDRIPSKDFLDTQDIVLAKYGETASRLFQHFFLYPHRYTLRAVEEASIHGHRLQLKVALTLDISKLRSEMPDGRGQFPSSVKQPAAHGVSNSTSPAQALVIPLIRVKKGDLIDLELQDAEGRAMPSASQWDTKALLSLTLKTLLIAAYGEGNLPNLIGAGKHADHRPRRNVARDLVLLASIVEAVQNDDEDDGAATELAEGIISELETYYKTEIKDPTAAAQLKDTCRFLAKYYLVAVEVPCKADATRIVVHYSRSMPVFSQARAMRDRWRLRFGLRPHKFVIPLYLPFASDSYHFKMAGISGQYCKHLFFADSKKLRPVKARTLKSQAVPHAAQPVIQSNSHPGLPWAHLYARHFYTRQPANINAVVRFNEIPPGVLGPAALIAAATAILIIIFAMIGVGDASNRGILSDLPGLLLALPAVAASWLGYTTDGDSLLRTSVSASIGVLLAGALSFLSALLFIVQQTGRMQFPRPQGTLTFVDQRFEFTLGPANVYWLILGAAAVLLTVYLSFMLYREGHYYLNLIKKWDDTSRPWSLTRVLKGV